MSNVSDIHLTYKENKALRKYLKLGTSAFLPNSRRLISYNLIKSNFVCQTPGNMPVSNDTYTITELGENYIQYRKEKIFLNKLPVIISIVALTKSFSYEISTVVIWLWKLITKQ
jgi:hypothetical protein